MTTQNMKRMFSQSVAIAQQRDNNEISNLIKFKQAINSI